jgi:hypothetical protein
MMVGATWPVAVAAVGPVTVGTTLWRLEGQTMVTVVVKMTFAFAQEREMTIVDPAEPIRTAEEHDGGHPMRSLLGAQETAPQLQRVDVLLTGYAYTTDEGKQTQVRLAIDSDRGNQLDKKLLVRGDRDELGEQQSFRRIKLGYERAYGGIGYAENPLGTGYGATNKPCNITYAVPPHDRTAGFGPIPSSFPSRKKLLGEMPRKVLKQRVAEIPLSFDWSYFQASPRDQRLNHLRGDEWLTLEGLHPTQRLIHTQLPSASGVARVYGADKAGVPDVVPLMADILHIDADAMRCSLTWRGSFPVSSENALDGVVIAGGLETPDEPMLWPESEADLHGLLDSDDSAGERIDATATRVGNQPPPAAVDHSATRVMAPDDHMAANHRLPFAGFSQAAFSNTRTVDAVSLAGSASDNATPFQSAPFAVAKPGPTSAGSAARIDIPGAPWAGKAASLVPMPREGMYSTLQKGSQNDDMARLQAEQQKAHEGQQLLEAQNAEAAKAATEAQEAQRAAEEAQRAADEKERQSREAREEAESRGGAPAEDPHCLRLDQELRIGSAA